MKGEGDVGGRPVKIFSKMYVGGQYTDCVLLPSRLIVPWVSYRHINHHHLERKETAMRHRMEMLDPRLSGNDLGNEM